PRKKPSMLSISLRAQPHIKPRTKYYKRVNNICQPMEGYEIRDVMNRKSAITLSLRIIPDLTRDQVRTESTITMNCGMHFLISVHNSGTRVAQYCLAELSADQH